MVPPTATPPHSTSLTELARASTIYPPHSSPSLDQPSCFTLTACLLQLHAPPRSLLLYARDSSSLTPTCSASMLHLNHSSSTLTPPHSLHILALPSCSISLTPPPPCFTLLAPCCYTSLAVPCLLHLAHPCSLLLARLLLHAPPHLLLLAQSCLLAPSISGAVGGDVGSKSQQ